MFKRPFKICIRSLLLAFLILCGASPAFPQAPDDLEISIPVSENSLVESICLYEVVDGRTRKTLIDADQLTPGCTIEAQGYVAGVVLYGRTDQLSAQVIEPASEETGGRQFFKKLMPDKKRADQAKPQKFSYFPQIAGDSVSSRDDFILSISSDTSNYDFTIRHKGYRPIYETPAVAANRKRSLVFRYIGGRSEQFTKSGPAFDTRINAISEGIQAVESTFGFELVQYVNIVDSPGHNNALSLKGKNEIWVYADTFWTNRPEELRSMGEHEALHILVDLKGLTDKTEIRSLFADLMEFGPLSKERFFVTATGRLPNNRSTKPAPDFFVFINERNFIEGMSGGHSHDNLDEFCTSFLHSLMYFEQLRQNLHKPLLAGKDDPPRVLCAQGQQNIVDKYIRALETFQKATDSTHASQAVYSACLENACQVASRGFMAEDLTQQ